MTELSCTIVQGKFSQLYPLDLPLIISNSILHRLPSNVPGQKPILQEIQFDLHPLEVLADIRKLLDEENVRASTVPGFALAYNLPQDQPLNAAFIKIVQAVSLYDNWLDVQLAIPAEDQQWAQHAVQSIVWKEAGL